MCEEGACIYGTPEVHNNWSWTGPLEVGLPSLQRDPTIHGPNIYIIFWINKIRYIKIKSLYHSLDQVSDLMILSVKVPN